MKHDPCVVGGQSRTLAQPMALTLDPNVGRLPVSLRAILSARATERGSSARHGSHLSGEPLPRGRTSRHGSRAHANRARSMGQLSQSRSAPRRRRSQRSKARCAARLADCREAGASAAEDPRCARDRRHPHTQERLHHANAPLLLVNHVPAQRAHPNLPTGGARLSRPAREPMVLRRPDTRRLGRLGSGPLDRARLSEQPAQQQTIILG
jgi:hypothetical protein